MYPGVTSFIANLCSGLAQDPCVTQAGLELCRSSRSYRYFPHESKSPKTYECFATRRQEISSRRSYDMCM